MTFYLVDLMPILWGIAMALSLWLAVGGEVLFLARFTAPSLVGFTAYLLLYPARAQVLAALVACVMVELGRLTVRLVCERKTSEKAVVQEEGV